MRTTIAAACLLTVALAAPVLAATFNDNNYHEYILYDVDTADIDVIIIPPASPYYARDISNIEQSIQAWEDGINAMAPAWLADGLTIRYYTAGYDDIPLDVLADPEIVVVSSEHDPVLLFGIGLEAPIQWCHDQEPFGSSQIHQHAGSDWGVFRAECNGGGYQCTVINTNFLWLPDTQNEREMYDLNSHEFGHCLGIGHVGDALDFSAKKYPSTDIMSYQHSTHVHCVSSLNIKALEAVYGSLLGQPSVAQPSGTYVQMSPGSYSQVDCKNPSNPSGTDVLAALPGAHDHPTAGSTLN